MNTPSALLGCPPEAIEAPAQDLRIATGGGRAIVGLVRDGDLRWLPVPVPAPLKVISDLDSVAYQRMWSGVLAVDLPSRTPLRIWFCDGESQVLLLQDNDDGFPELILT